MKRLILFLSIITSLHSFSQCNIKNVYADIFTVKKQSYNENTFLIKQVNLVDQSVCFSELINKNNQHIDYLLTNFSNRNKDSLLLGIESDNDRSNEFINNLKKDSLFSQLINELVLRHTDENFICDTISIDEVLNIAVKFFSITGLTDEGYYMGKVCVGINGLDKTEPIRHPHIEAFCFSSILANYNSKRYGMYDEFVEGIKNLYKLNLGVDPDEKLFRAQGAMYMYMLHNKPLKAMLLEEFNKKKDYLPFVIVD